MAALDLKGIDSDAEPTEGPLAEKETKSLARAEPMLPEGKPKSSFEADMTLTAATASATSCQAELSLPGSLPGTSATATAPSYARRARVLSIGVGMTGLVTFAYFSVASHVLSAVDYKQIAVLWSVMFVIATVIYRPIEQLLSRTIASRVAQGDTHSHPVRGPLIIQLVFALIFLVLALAFRPNLQNGVFGGSQTLYWILVVGILAYAASYFARGWLAGHQRVGLYGGLMLMESCSRFLFAVAVAIGIAEGQSAIALGMAAAPFVSLVVVPFAFARRRGPKRAQESTDSTCLEEQSEALRRDSGPSKRKSELALGRGSRFAGAVFVVMLSEQTILNAGVLTVNATATDAALAGFVFSAFLIARAPLQLFQAVQGSLLPHLAGLEATAGAKEFQRSVRITVLAIGAFGLTVAAGLLVVGPFAMDLLFGGEVTYNRFGLAMLGLGMGAHLIAGTLNQAALARDRAGAAASVWMLSALLFVTWMLVPLVEDQLLRAEVGYFLCAGLLWLGLWLLYRSGAPKSA